MITAEAVLERMEPLVRALAAQIDGRGQQHEDLVQEGRLAVMEACRHACRACPSFFSRRAEWAMRDYLRRGGRSILTLSDSEHDLSARADAWVAAQIEAALMRAALGQLAARAGLTRGERRVLERLLAGEVRSRSQQTVLCRAKAKLRRALRS